MTRTAIGCGFAAPQVVYISLKNNTMDYLSNKKIKERTWKMKIFTLQNEQRPSKRIR